MNNGFQYLVFLLVIALILDLLIIHGWKRYSSLRQKTKRTGKPIKESVLVRQAFLGKRLNDWLQHPPVSAQTRIWLAITLELVVLVLWAINVGWDYLDMDPRVFPTGNEFGSAIQGNHMWAQFAQCGWCAVWNGFQRGGYPAFADIQGSMLHPIVIGTTLLWGVVNGSKIAVVVSLWFAGVAQWWIARELDLGWLPRMWSAGIAIAGGHLAGRMELGVPGLVLSIAMTSLVFAAFIRLARSGKRRDAVLLGITTASAIVSGQGYMQVGLIGVFPIVILFLVKRVNKFVAWKNYLIAAILALLLSAPLLVPLAHFSPNIAKYADSEFRSAQPLSYLVLNLVVDDPDYFLNGFPQKLPYPHLYVTYIGWIPILLAIFALYRIPQKYRRIIYFMTAGIIMEFLIASALLLKWLANIWPSIAGVRHPPQIASLAIPLILGLSAVGLERLLWLRWEMPAWPGATGRRTRWKLHPGWVLVIPLIWSLQSCFRFAQAWIGTRHVPESVYNTLTRLKTDEMQWVAPPYGEHIYVEPAIAMGMKLSPGILTWVWRNRPIPPPIFYAKHMVKEPDPAGKAGPISGMAYYIDDTAHYAGVVTDDKILPCRADGSGGYIQVVCNTEQVGRLIVQENMWTGWQAWMDGNRVKLTGNDKLEVAAPAGSHTFTFKYLPWDVPIGLVLFAIGIVLSAQFWMSPKDKSL